MALIAAQIQQVLFEQCHINSSHKILVAVSGGVDSMVLLGLVAQACKAHSIEVGVFHLDHMYRGDEAIGDSRLVGQFCKKLELKCHAYRRPIQAIANAKGLGFEELARFKRYQLLDTLAYAHGYTHVLTAHHMQDNVETLFMHLFRGSGIDGLVAMRSITTFQSRKWHLVRPLLQTTKQALYEYAKDWQIPFAEDSSNLDTLFFRNKIRQQLLPYIEDLLGSPIQERVAHTIQLLEQDANFLEGQTQVLVDQSLSIENDVYTIRKDLFRDAHLSLQRRFIRLLLKMLNGHIKDLNATEVDGLVYWFNRAEVGKTQVKYDWHFESRQDLIRCMPKDAIGQKSEVKLTLGVHQLANWGIQVRVEIHEQCPQDHPYNYVIPLYAPYTLPEFSIRSRKPGDTISLKGMKGNKSLKKLLSESKLTLDQKERLPLLVYKDCVIWVVGIRKGELKSVEIDKRSDDNMHKRWIVISVFPL